MSEVEKALSPWGRFREFSRRSLWKIACGMLVLGFICCTWCVCKIAGIVADAVLQHAL